MILYAEKGENDEVKSRIETILDSCEEGKGFFQPPIVKQGLSKYAADWIGTLLEGKSFEPVESSEVEGAENEPPSKRKPAPSTTSNKKARKEAVEDLPIEKDLIESNPEGYVGRRCSKFFGDELYFGRIKKYTPKVLDGEMEESQIWKVVYDDNDKEEYDVEDMVEYLSLYKENESQDPEQ